MGKDPRSPGSAGPVLAGELIYLVTPAGEVSAHDVRTGEPRWHHELGSSAASAVRTDGEDMFTEEISRILPDDGVLYVRTSDSIVALSKEY
ncbi:PQQ-binding-like beta-propeller repeat protein [Nonomuraea sp. NPDC050680]|uniref:outer membrane protein assembly factor BamB family protein n=1 Tax=Nonomuraea sp. NPDC050680 TaxID=3154630 RepID=UPI0033CF5E29